MPHYNADFTTGHDWWHDTTHRVEPSWRSWYRSSTWKSIRRHRLAEESRCRQCAIEGWAVAASHVDHIEPHLGSSSLFFKYENTQSLCSYHHNILQRREKLGSKKALARYIAQKP
jgi:hypothetical protein